jgi:hypothetical protein
VWIVSTMRHGGAHFVAFLNTQMSGLRHWA